MVIRIVAIQIKPNDRNSSVCRPYVVVDVATITEIVVGPTNVCGNNAHAGCTVSLSYFLWRLLLNERHEPEAPIGQKVVECSIGPPSQNRLSLPEILIVRHMELLKSSQFTCLLKVLVYLSLKLVKLSLRLK